MKIRELAGWPPIEFECTGDTITVFHPARPRDLRIQSVSYVPGDTQAGKTADIVLLLANDDRTEECTAKVKISDGELARRSQAALGLCKGLTLDQAGLRKIPDT